MTASEAVLIGFLNASLSILAVGYIAVLFEHNVSSSKQLELISEAVSVSNSGGALYVCAYATHGARIIIQ